MNTLVNVVSNIGSFQLKFPANRSVMYDLTNSSPNFNDPRANHHRDAISNTEISLIIFLTSFLPSKNSNSIIQARGKNRILNPLLKWHRPKTHPIQLVTCLYK